MSQRCPSSLFVLLSMSRCAVRVALCEMSQRTGKAVEKSEENYWVIHGEAYDCTTFVKTHPGGTLAISLGQNRDCTALFESYHALSDKAWQVLQKYKIKSPDTAAVHALTQHKWAQNDPFYNELKEQVRLYFESNKLSHKGYWFSLIVLPVYLWVFFANYWHDASHFALSRRQWPNMLVLWAIPYLQSPTSWLHQHVVGHHVYTNDEKRDPDVLYSLKARRITYRFSMFFWSFYTMLAGWAFDADFFVSKLYKAKVPMAPYLQSTPRFVMHFLGRTAYFYLCFVLPFSWFAWPKALVFALVPQLVFSFCFGLCTQFNHLSLGTFRENKSSSWAAHEMLTSMNIATASTFWYVFSGALTHQTEHHLFPGVCAEHYPAIQPIVKQVCAKHGIPYLEAPSYWVAFKLHLDLLATCTNTKISFSMNE